MKFTEDTPKRKKLLYFIIAALCALISLYLSADTSSESQPLVGKWYGILEISGRKLPVHFMIVFNQQKQYEGLLSSGTFKGPIDTIEDNNGNIKLTIANIGADFEGKLDASKKKLTGKWKQSGATVDLSLDKMDQVPVKDPKITDQKPKRPQTPQRPFPYDEEEVVVENKAANIKLAGTLTLPREKGPFPAVLLITGSGAQDRDETLFEHRPFLVISDYLTRKGIAVLRVDDRGVGKSTGDIAKSTSEDFAGDAKACFEFLCKHPKINSKRVGLIGHSEGGGIASKVASETPEVAFIVLMAGPGLKGSELIHLQRIALYKALGTEQAAADRIIGCMKKIDETIMANEKPDTLRTKITEILAKDSGFSEPEQKMLASQPILYVPWYRYFLMFDPAPVLKKVKCPVLALNGEKDFQVLAKENLGAIEKNLAESGNKRVTIKLMPGLNHLFQNAKTGTMQEYYSLEETIAPIILETMGDWIKSVAGGR